MIEKVSCGKCKGRGTLRRFFRRVRCDRCNGTGVTNEQVDRLGDAIDRRRDH